MLERNVPTGEAPLAIKAHSKHERNDMFTNQLRKVSIRDKFQQQNKVTSDVEMRVLFAKRAKELSLNRPCDVQFDYDEEKSIPATVRQGRRMQSKGDYDKLRFSQT